VKKSVLIVDDELLVRKALGRLLTHEGYHVREAENGAQGLAFYLEQPSDFVFLDIMMPVMNGIEFMQHLKSKGFNLSHIIVMSAVDEASQFPFVNEVKTFISKPFENLFTIKDLLHEHD
jgi:two-component system response regulator